jgi:hypothetical protein
MRGSASSASKRALEMNGPLRYVLFGFDMISPRLIWLRITQSMKRAVLATSCFI